MKKLMLALVLVFTLFIFIYPTNSKIYANVDVQDEVHEAVRENREVPVIVVLKDDSATKEPQTVEEAKQAVENTINKKEEVIDSLSRNEFEKEHDFSLISAFSGNITESGLEKLKENPNVEAVFIDDEKYIFLSESIPMINASLIHPLQYKGLNLTGTDYSICILDTGVNYNHVLLGSGWGNKVIAGYDFVNSDSDPLDDHGHGSHVAGIAAAKGSLTGVAPDANIVAIKVCNSGGSCTDSNILAGIEWCINNASVYNITVISMSLGSGLYDNYCDSDPSVNSLYSTDINLAVNNNISVVISSGNGLNNGGSGRNNSISQPACIQNATPVGSVNDGSSGTTVDSISSFTDRGVNFLDYLLAPGKWITSADDASSTATATRAGTSMAAPHVSGLVVLLQQYKQQVEGLTLTSQEIEDVLKDTGFNITDTDTNITYPRVDAYAAILSIDSTPPDLSINSPENITYYINTSLSLDITADDFFLDSCWYNFDNSTNLTLPNCADVTFNISEGSHTLYMYANDTAGNENSSQVIFYVSGGFLDTVLNSPINDTNDADGNVTFNCSASTNLELVNISLYHDLSGNFTLNQTNSISGNSSSTNFTLISIPDNTNFIWNCLATNNQSVTSWAATNYTVNILINDAPSIIWWNWTNISTSSTVDTELRTLENSAVSFEIVTSDPENDSLNYSWSLDGAEQVTTQNWTYTPSYTSNGTHNITVLVTDGSLNDMLVWNITIENVDTIPTWSNISIQSWTKNTDKDIDLDAYASDVDGDDLTYTSTLPDNIAISINQNSGIVTLTPALDWIGIEYIMFYATDPQGNNATSNNVTLTVSNPSSDSGSSGSGGFNSGLSSGSSASTTSSARASMTFASVGSGSLNKFSIGSSVVPVSEVDFILDKTATNVKLTVEKLDSKPDSVSAATENIYDYLDISLSNFGTSSVTKATINFKVENIWINKNSIDANTIRLNRYSSSWQPLPTSKLSSDSTYTYYRSSSPGFSTFAITGNKKVVQQITDTEIVEEPKTVIEEVVEEVKNPIITGEMVGIGKKVTVLGSFMLVFTVLLIIGIVYYISKFRRPNYPY